MYVIYPKRITDCLNLCEGKNVLLKNEFGEAVLTPKMDSGLPNDMVFIPMGPWANILVGKDTGGCGTPQFKGLEVDVAATDSPVISYSRPLQTI